MIFVSHSYYLAYPVPGILVYANRGVCCCKNEVINKINLIGSTCNLQLCSAIATKNMKKVYLFIVYMIYQTVHCF